jgi:hypothetical protein
MLNKNLDLTSFDSSEKRSLVNAFESQSNIPMSSVVDPDPIGSKTFCLSGSRSEKKGNDKCSNRYSLKLCI